MIAESVEEDSDFESYDSCIDESNHAMLATAGRVMKILLD